MTTEFGKAIRALTDEIASRATERDPCDTEKDGILFCGKCGEPKQALIELLIGEDGEMVQKLVSVVCRCQIEQDEREKARLRKVRFEQRLKDSRAIIGGKRSFDSYSFASDDSPTSPISKTCRRYVEQWDDMQKNNMGILFCGRKGTGKSFYAMCIANALAEKQILTGFTTTTALMSTLQGSWEKDEIIDAVCRFRLLVLDDLGAERNTSYGDEMIYNIINERYLTNRPTIVTTNFSLEEMKSESDMWRSRIYDRVIEMCPIPLRMDGESRRSGIADTRRQMARDFLSGKTDGDGA